MERSDRTTMESVQEYDEEPGFNLDEFVDTNVDEVFD